MIILTILIRIRVIVSAPPVIRVVFIILTNCMKSMRDIKIWNWLLSKIIMRLICTNRFFKTIVRIPIIIANRIVRAQQHLHCQINNLNPNKTTQRILTMLEQLLENIQIRTNHSVLYHKWARDPCQWNRIKREIMWLNNTKMGVDIKDIKVMVWEMERGNFTISKAASMMDSGRIIICMDMENCIILIISWRMKENGLLTSFMVEAEFLMISLQLSMDFLTIQILII